MKRSNYKKIMTQLYKIRTELFQTNHQPKFKIGEEVYYIIGYGIEKKKITHIVMMGDDPAWFYSFDGMHDYLREDRIYRLDELTK